MSSQMKPAIVSMLMEGHAVADVASKLNQPIALVRQYNDDLTPDERVGKAIQVIAIEKAKDILASGEAEPELMKRGIATLSKEILEAISTNMNNPDTAQIMAIHSKTLSNIHELLFGKGNINVEGDVNVVSGSKEAEDFVGKLRP